MLKAHGPRYEEKLPSIDMAQDETRSQFFKGLVKATVADVSGETTVVLLERLVFVWR